MDVVEATEPFDAAQFVRLASPAVSAIQGRNRVPILCGGTGLYFKAFLEGLGEAPPGDPALRAQYIKGRGEGRDRRDREPDPNSPFAKLAALKEQLEASKER